MKVPRYSTSRRKACDQCCKAKVRCIPGAGCCTRCYRRGEKCQNNPKMSSGSSPVQTDRRKQSGVPSSPVAFSESVNPHDSASANEIEPDMNCEAPSVLSPSGCNPSDIVTQQSSLTHQLISHVHHNADHLLPTDREENLSFDSVEHELICPINADDIQNRWLSSYIPTPEQTIKEYPNNVVCFMSRMFKSYAAAAINGRAMPPFVHLSQSMASDTCLPLKTCLSMIRLLENCFPGSQDVAISTIQQEMRKLYPINNPSDSITLLATFQAYLIYTMVLYFSVKNLSKSFLRQSMMIIQDLACMSSRQGLVSLAEQQFARPRWEAWIVSEAKRRTLYTMCMFDSILLSREGLPNYLSIELKGLPAPSSKKLWQLLSRQTWERSYNFHLAEWPEEFLRIDELWPLPLDLDENGVNERSCRVDRWLEGVDEFGTMLFAVTSCTHGT